MILVTGDTHGVFEDFAKLREDKLQSLTADDYIVICGDAGFAYFPTDEQVMQYGDQKLKARISEVEQLRQQEHDALDWLSQQPWTTLFVDGNHENFPRLYEYPVKDFCSGKAAQLRDKVWHLRRGEVYEICGKTCFAMGGATSVDKHMRKEGISWWPQEIPTEEEWQNAHDNLERHKWKVDYVFTHSVAESTRTKISQRFEDRHALMKLQDEITVRLEEIQQKLKFKNWYFGHWHRDEQYGKIYALYRRIIFAGGPPPSARKGRERNDGNVTYQMIECAKLGWLEDVEYWAYAGGDIAKLPVYLRASASTYLMAQGVWQTYANRSSTTLLKRLIKYGADIEVRNDNGYTPLLAALFQGHYEAARELMKHGADVTAKANGGHTALTILEADWITENRLTEGYIKEGWDEFIGLLRPRLQRIARMKRLIRKKMGEKV